MSLCARIKADGERCKGVATGGSGWCYAHDPALAEQRRSNASKGGRAGGRGRPRSETDRYKSEIRTMIGGVLKGGLPSSHAAVIFQGYNTILRICELERRQSVVRAFMTHEEMAAQTQVVFAVLQRHLSPEQLRALDEELGEILDEASG